MKNLSKYLLCLCFIFLFIGAEAAQIADQSERMKSNIEILSVPVPAIEIAVDLPKKPFSLKIILTPPYSKKHYYNRSSIRNIIEVLSKF